MIMSDVSYYTKEGLKKLKDENLNKFINFKRKRFYRTGDKAYLSKNNYYL